ncbi:MAG: hypothetical protein ACOYM7_07230 [Paludibacter sp.]
MKNKLLIATVVFAMGTMYINAQMHEGKREDGEHKRVTPEMRADKMAEHLQLSISEKAKVLELFKQEEVKMLALKEEVKKLKEKSEVVGKEQKEKFEALRKTHDTELEKIIGKEKMEKMHAEHAQGIQKMRKMEEMHKQMHKRMDGQMSNHQQGMGPKPEKMKNMKAVFAPEKRAERMQAELGLTDAEKESLTKLFVDQEKKIAQERKQKFEEMKNANDAAVEKIIGKEKMAKFIEIRKQQVEKVKKHRNA